VKQEAKSETMKMLMNKFCERSAFLRQSTVNGSEKLIDFKDIFSFKCSSKLIRGLFTAQIEFTPLFASILCGKHAGREKPHKHFKHFMRNSLPYQFSSGE
jgi:hypothetical protein